MGLTLRNASRWPAKDLFEPWDPATGDFLTAEAFPGKLSRADRFTTIYHRPTRRAYIRFPEVVATPASGVVRRQGTDEIYLLSDTARTEVYQNQLIYDRLRMSHLATPPSGGLGSFFPASVAGTGDDLGIVTMDEELPVYVDLELQSQVDERDSIDLAVPRFLLNYSKNVTPEPGDYFKFKDHWYVTFVPYIDGGLCLSRVERLDPAYTTLTYRLRSGTGSYDPATGTITNGIVDRLFSGIFGKRMTEGQVTKTARETLELFIYKRHLGFEPRIGDTILEGSTTYTITSVTDTRVNQQWKLEVVR